MAMRLVASLVTGDKDIKGKPIPHMKDPVANYPLPPFEEFLQTPIGFKHFSAFLAAEHAKENLDCYLAIGEFKENPSAEKALALWDEFIHRRAVRNVNLTAAVYNDLEAGVAALKKAPGTKPKKSMFNDAQAALVSLMNLNNWITFRTKIEYFEPWLMEAKGTTVTKLRKEWWEANKKNKWGNAGLPCSNTVFQKYVEYSGNVLTEKEKKKLSNYENPETLEGKHVRVFWPADNVTRVCKLLKYSKTKGHFLAHYYFNDKEMEEDLQTDWAEFIISVECASCGEDSGPSRCCEVCGSKMVLE